MFVVIYDIRLRISDNREQDDELNQKQNISEKDFVKATILEEQIKATPHC